jgi:hypothetical protein
MSLQDLAAVAITSEECERADEALAYVLLEEARLVCDRLRHEAGSHEELDVILEAHGDVGLAGYTVSDRMDPPLRHALLGLVRERRIAETLTPDQCREHVLLLCLHAADVLERATTTPRTGPDLRSARVRTHDAVVGLSRLVGPRRAGELRREISRIPV